MKRRKRQDGPETYMQQIWYLISVANATWHCQGYTMVSQGHGTRMINFTTQLTLYLTGLKAMTTDLA
jgi:hypothetical protein